MKYRFLFILILLSASLAAQTTVPYSHDYEFREGVFLNYTQFITNSPILKSKIVSAVPADQVDFLTEVLEQKMLTYKDTSGAEIKVEVNSLWGYCQNRALYINFNNGFDRINLIGNLSLFSSIILRTPIQRDPLGDMYSIPYEELHQFVLDTQTNKVWEFNVKNMEMLLQQKDDVLYQAFMKLKKREKSDSIFIYLRKYNEKHPLMLPAK